MSGLDTGGDQRPEWDRPHPDSPHWPHGGPEWGCPRCGVEAGPCPRGEAVVDSKEAGDGGRGSEGVCGAGEVSQTWRGHTAHCAVACEAANCPGPAPFRLGEVHGGREWRIGDPVQ